MSQEERTNINEKIQEYCQYWVQILNLQKWVIVAYISDDIGQKMTYDVATGAASIPIVAEEEWQKHNPNLPYDMEISLIHNLLCLMLEVKRPNLTLNYLARILVQFRRTINPEQTQ